MATVVDLKARVSRGMARIGRLGASRRSDDDAVALRRQVLHLALPAAAEQFLDMMVSVVDTMLVGHLGATALAAVSLATEWVFLATTLFGALSTGATALVARAVGGRDWNTAHATVRQALLIGLAIGLLSTLLAVTFAEPAVRLMGAEPDVLPGGVAYLRIVAGAFGLSAVMFIGNACLRGAGNTRTTMVVMGVVNLINIVVTWIAINGPFGLPRLGVVGSALGTVAGRAVGGLLVVAILLRGRAGLKLHLRGWRLDRTLIRRILNVGLPTGLEQLAFRAGGMTFIRVVASLGTVAVAAHTVALRAESISFMPGFGFAIAGTTLIGQGLGAGEPRRAEQSGYVTYRIAAGLMAVIGLAFVLAPRAVVGLFTRDPEVIQMAAVPLRMVGFVQPIIAAVMVFAGCLRGAGDTRFPMLVTAVSMWLVRVPTALLLGRLLGYGLLGAWIGMVLDLTMRGTLNFLRFRAGRWKSIQV